MSVTGIIFSNLHDNEISELTRVRTLASVPFGCRYRLIDFTLSNVVNAGITNVGVLTHYNYKSLMDHLGTGKDWDLARRNGGIKILPPFITAFANRDNSLFASRLEALISARQFISECTEEQVLLCDCDIICNLDLTEMLRAHEESGAEVTVAVKNRPVGNGLCDVSIVHSDENGRILDVTNYNDDEAGDKDVQLHIMVCNRQFLLSQLTEAVAHGYTSIAKNILTRGAKNNLFRIFRFDGYCETVGSLSEYYRRNMDLLEADVQDTLFRQKNRPVLTSVQNSAPTVYAENSLVKNSLIADGCVIEGIVENSIIFRGVHVGKNTSVENCILMQDTYIGNHVYLNCVVTDKGVTVRDGRVLSGHENRPFYIEKSTEV